jgi:uncharacterized protein YjhX (UPF0386 family)
VVRRLLALALECLALAGLSSASVGLVASIDVKADEVAASSCGEAFRLSRCGSSMLRRWKLKRHA